MHVERPQDRTDGWRAMAVWPHARERTNNHCGLGTALRHDSTPRGVGSLVECVRFIQSITGYTLSRERRPGGYCRCWCRHGESNAGPTHYECVALPAELCRLNVAGIIYPGSNYFKHRCSTMRNSRSLGDRSGASSPPIAPPCAVLRCAQLRAQTNRLSPGTYPPASCTTHRQPGSVHRQPIPGTAGDAA